MRRTIATLVLVLATLSHGESATAREVSFPIVLDSAFVRQLLVQQLYQGEGESAVVWHDESGCSELILRNPEVVVSAAGVEVTSAFSGKLGAGVGQLCLGASEHSGFVELVLAPRLPPVVPVIEFRVVDSRLLGTDRQKRFSGTLWDWVKGIVHPRLEAFRVDLRRPIHELQLVLPAFLVAEDAAQTQTLLDSIRLSAVGSAPDALSATVTLAVPEVPPVTEVPLPEPTLTVEEVQRWEAAWHSWDAFLTFIIKRAGTDSVSPDLLAALRRVLLEARYDLLPALRPTSPSQTDPVRPLFLRTWKRLQPVLREVSVGVPGEGAIRYLSFVAAADALAALDELGPGFGFHISAPGLRRLARTIDPGSVEDATRYSTEVDPDLRRLFGFGPPLPVPEIPTPAATEVIDEDPSHDPTHDPAEDPTHDPTHDPAEEPTAETPTVAPTATDESSPGATPEEATATPVPPATPSPAPTLEEEFIEPPPRPVPPQSWWRGLPDFFVSRAEASVNPTDLKRLYRWVPSRDELKGYLVLVRDVLIKAREETKAELPIDAAFRDVYDNLVFAAAWQETCWRQFIRVRKQVQTISSPVGAVGIMQVHSKVWRGFYNVDALKADIAYNARAGSEILRHYMLDYAVKKGEHKVKGNVHDLARATYSAYNAGPRGLSRYRRAPGQKKGSIDAKFFEKYQQVRAGKELSVVSCYGGGPA